MYKFWIVFMVVLLLSGCVTAYDQEDIENYLQEKYALEDFFVESRCVEVKGDDGYTDYVWDASYGDLQFQVLDDYHWGMESLTNTLRDNYTDWIVKDYYCNTDLLPHFELEETMESGIYKNQLVATFSSKEELMQRMDELVALHIYAIQNGTAYPSSFSYHLEMQSPIRNHLPQYTIDDGDAYGMVTNLTADKIQQVLETFMLTYLDYHFEDVDRKFTTAEIVEVVSRSDEQIGIINDGQIVLYADLCASQYHYGISFGTLYEILKRENFAVQGSNSHYWFTVNGDRYEISYDFYVVDPYREEDSHYYYLKNDEKVFLQYFYNHFTENQILEMCGLHVYIGTPESYKNQ